MPDTPDSRPSTLSPDVTTDPALLREIAVSVAAEAAGHVRARRPDLFPPADTGTDRVGAVRTKSTDTDPVTVADTETEDLIRRLLTRLRPGDAILGEEGGAHTGSSGVRWVVDPIDGTVNFVYGIPAYAVSVAAQVGGRSVAGAVVDVSAGDVYSAARGRGATRTDVGGAVTRLRCNPVDDVARALVATGFSYAPHRRERQGALVAGLLPRVRDIRRIGAAALDLCMVASGRVDAHYEHGLQPWDWAAGALIAAEAGAWVQLPAGAGDAGEITIAAAPGIATQLADLFAALGADAPIPA
ncbi:onositol-1-monophosphatase [Rhodococcus aetherivorans]|uniref:Inositol-1-monophosphatase n=1 Tax=Rhodococcus aetherivorans TaxID=191292 RepID=A0ABQ0YL38_9NOCA|nr:inositol monophosphatase family protein [Rhodococcus aetherivorans]ETT27540.1 Inositol-phosphate phosphatase [Rhodococcus rhodochrous ATCC 21198]KDE13602.1 inositol monophosphatase [Rhodococcus aetherivorans]NGP25489.1 inositol monophosphatase [Rhodococcus aetherivorans]GES37184.1 onositol-1-monophosphatase [Rhodococcus aetherivorans]